MTTGRINQVASRVERPALLLTHSTSPTDAPHASPATLTTPKGDRTKSLRGAWQAPTPRTSRGINGAEPTSSSFPKAPKGNRRTTSARQVVTSNLPLGAIQPPYILKLRSGRYDIVNLLNTHLRRCGPEDPHRSSLSRVQRVSLVL